MTKKIYICKKCGKQCNILIDNICSDCGGYTIKIDWKNKSKKKFEHILEDSNIKKME